MKRTSNPSSCRSKYGALFYSIFMCRFQVLLKGSLTEVQSYMINCISEVQKTTWHQLLFSSVCNLYPSLEDQCATETLPPMSRLGPTCQFLWHFMPLERFPIQNTCISGWRPRNSSRANTQAGWRAMQRCLPVPHHPHFSSLMHLSMVC